MVGAVELCWDGSAGTWESISQDLGVESSVELGVAIVDLARLVS